MASLSVREEGCTQLAVVTVARNWPSLGFNSHYFTNPAEKKGEDQTMSCCTAGHLGSGVGQPDLNQYLPSLGLTFKMWQGNKKNIELLPQKFKPVLISQGHQGSAEDSIQRRLATCSRGGG